MELLPRKYLPISRAVEIGHVNEDRANLAFANSWGVFVAHHSGEITNDFSADLSVGLRTSHLKTGVPCRAERIAKYNCPMDIEDRIKASGEEVVCARAIFGEVHDFGVGMSTRPP